MAVPKDKRLGLTRRKGWPAYVHGWRNFIKEYDGVEWDGKGTIKPKKVEEVGVGRTRITF